MGGLGNGRRGGRSPPLLVGALIACILVLGFNYWVSSSRNLELQTKLYELEGQIRRGAAERGAAEVKKTEFQEEIQRQKEQIIQIENAYKKKLKAAQDVCSQDKVLFQHNISSCGKAAQELKGQLIQLNNDLAKQKKDLQSCQGSVNTLNNKLTYDMTNCHSQVLSQKEVCDERVEAAKLEVQKKMEKLIPPPGAPSQVNSLAGATKPEELGKAGNHTVTTTVVVNHTSSLSQPKGNEPLELLTNDIVIVKAPDVSGNQTAAQGVTNIDVDKQDTLQPPEVTVKTQAGQTKSSQPVTSNGIGNKVEVMDVHGDDTHTDDPGMEGILSDQGKETADETADGLKLEEAEDYDADDQIEGVDLLKEQSKKTETIDKDMEDELADYNGDDENEGEFEADKQAELARN